MESFSQRTKEELIRRIPDKKCCVKAELSAIIHSIGSIYLSGNTMSLLVTGESASLIKKTLMLLKTTYEVSPRIIAEETERLGHRRRYNLQLFGAELVKKILRELAVMEWGYGLQGGIDSGLVQFECCRRAFLRGAFISRGSITDPLKSDYHLEIVTENEEYAQGLVYLMNLCGFKAGLHKRRDYFIYLKDIDVIGRFLTFIGAHTAFLQLEEVRVVKGMRANVNRLVNCETANLEKTVRAALEQVEIISELEHRMGLDFLPDNLKEIAWLRLENPEASLRELGELTQRKLSKSAINYRMRKLLKLAKTSLGKQEKPSVR
ncbi:MAG TPA: DNA-binding protein WhiA [Firmicutes bacterium]|nr:DNA-binding protein WhiA [Bacillota bacterium]